MATPNDKCLLRRERERAKRSSETPAQRQIRLQKAKGCGNGGYAQSHSMILTPCILLTTLATYMYA